MQDERARENTCACSKVMRLFDAMNLAGKRGAALKSSGPRANEAGRGGGGGGGISSVLLFCKNGIAWVRAREKFVCRK